MRLIGGLIRFALLISLFLFAFDSNLFAGNKIGDEIKSHKKSGKFSGEVLDLFTKSTQKLDLKAHHFPTNSGVLEIKQSMIDKIIKNKPQFISVTIPFENKVEKFLLYKVENNTKVIEHSTRKVMQSDVINYRGSTENTGESDLATITVSPDEVLGSFIIGTETIVVQKVFPKGSDREKKNPLNKSTHVLYSKKDETRPPFQCTQKTDATQTSQTIQPSNTSSTTTTSNQPQTSSLLTSKNVRFYAEVANDIYNSKGGTAGAQTYIQGVFNQINAIYYNDGISTSLGTIYVWNTTDPYVGMSSGSALTTFGNNRSTGYDGDLAILVNYSPSNGGIAYVGQLCRTSSLRVSYCGISSTYNTYPNYSWSVECMTHELGHLMGSPHTHACAWNGNNTAIDGCALQYSQGLSEGSCAQGPIPSGTVGGTVMSYCHLLSTVGINFNLGFGEQPKTLITGKVNSATCLGNSSSTPDTESPMVTILAPLNNATISGQNVSFNASATDNNFVSKIELYIDSTLLSTSFNSSNIYSLDTSNYTNGAHTLTAKAYDPSGNMGTASINVTISNTVANDTVPPTTTLTFPTEGMTIAPLEVN